MCTLHGCSHLYVDIDCDRICDGGLCCDNAMNQVDPDCDFNSKLVIVGSNTSETFDKVCLDLSMLV